jgi:hypothetical protein
MAAFVDVTAAKPYLVSGRQQMRAVMLRRAFFTILVVIGLALSGVQPFAVLSAEAGGFGSDTVQMSEDHECEEHGAAHAMKNGGHCCVSGAAGFVPATAAIAGIWPSKVGRIVGVDERAPTDRNIAIFEPPRAG